MRRLSKRTVAVFAALVIVLVGAGVAFAYWTSGGGGTGTASTGTSTDLVVNQNSVVTGMGPGVAAQDLNGDFTNNGTTAAHVGTLTAEIGAITGADGACTADDYVITGSPMTVDDVIPPTGVPAGAWSGATIAFANSPTVNQDGCKNAAVAIVYTVDATP
jgi:hypothetical protein